MDASGFVCQNYKSSVVLTEPRFSSGSQIAKGRALTGIEQGHPADENPAEEPISNPPASSPDSVGSEGSTGQPAVKAAVAESSVGVANDAAAESGRGTRLSGRGSLSARNAIRPPIAPGDSATGPRLKVTTIPKSRAAKARRISSPAKAQGVSGWRRGTSPATSRWPRFSPSTGSERTAAKSSARQRAEHEHRWAATNAGRSRKRRANACCRRAGAGPRRMKPCGPASPDWPAPIWPTSIRCRCPPPTASFADQPLGTSGRHMVPAGGKEFADRTTRRPDFYATRTIVSGAGDPSTGRQ